MHFKHIGQWMLAAMAACSLFSGAQEASDSVKAQPNQLSVDLQFLSRGEMRYGGLPNTTEEEENGEKAAKSNFAQSRTRLVINYKRDWLEARVTPQHSGGWGQAGKGAFNLYETWVKMTARNGLFAQVGRVALSYDDERIIGSDNWAMASQSHDVVRLGYEGHGHKAHVILAYNQNANVMNDGGSYYVGGAQPYKTMQDVWYHYDLPKFPLGVSVLFMNIGMQGDEDTGFRTYFQHLLGSYVSFTPKRWKAEAAYYHQFGKNESGMKIDAWMASGKLTFSPKANYGFVGGFDYLSGDKLFAVPPQGGLGMVHHDVIRGFSSVYGSHHKFYGAMDFFYVSAYFGTFSPGLQNLYAGVIYKPIKGLSINAAYHYLATTTNLEELHKTLGHEIELTASYNFMKDAKLGMGFSFMKGTETMESLKRSTDDHVLQWGWLMLNVSPRLFYSKW